MKDLKNDCEMEKESIYLEERSHTGGCQEREQAERLGDMLAGDMAELCSAPAEAALEWMDSQAALIEACHLAWCTGRLHDRQGRKMGFARIVRMVCRRLHVSVPRNPSAIIYKARLRKGVRVGSLLSRYLLLQRQGFRDPFRLCVRRRHRHGRP